MPRRHNRAPYPYSLISSPTSTRITRIEFVLNRWESLVWDQDHQHEPKTVRRIELRNRGGRPSSTEDIAVFVHARKEIMTMKEIAVAWVAAFPDDSRIKDRSPLARIELLRGAWRRHFGDKKQEKKG